MSFPQHNISRPRHNITSPEVNMTLLRMNISGYSISSRSHDLICLGYEKTAPPGHLYLCVGSPKKINVLTQPVFTVYPITQNKSSSYVPLCKLVTITFHTVWMLYMLLALAYISYKVHHCSFHFCNTDAILSIVITEESNINVCFILYTSTIRTKCYELLL